MRGRWVVVVAGLAVALAGGARLAAGQNMPTAKGPDSYLAFGGEVTAFQADYGKRLLGGGTVYGDLNMTWRYGVESEARYLRIHTDEDVTQTDYLVGPRVMFRPGRFRPYAKFLVGAGRMTFPFHYADGTFFVYAPGGGVDWILGDRVTFRVADFEYQMWPSFGGWGELRPYGLSAGISWRVNAREHLVKTAERWRWK